MSNSSINAQLFSSKTDYEAYLENEFKIIKQEWVSLAKINNGEGDVAKFFEACKTTNDLVSKLLLPTVLLALQNKEAISFADIFEEKRTNIKRYKQLKQQIKENQEVEQAVTRVMGFYEKQDGQERKHSKLQGKTKGFYQKIEQNTLEANTELKENQEKYDSLLWEKGLWEEKDESLVIANLAQQANQIFNTCQEKEKEYNFLAEEYKQLQQNEKELLYLRDKQERDIKLAKLQEAKERLQKQEEKEPDNVVREELAQVFAQLRWWCDQREETYKQEIILLKKKETRIEAELVGFREKIRQQEKNHQDLEKQQTIYTERIKHLREEQLRIAKDILANHQEQRVSEELTKWQQEIVDTQTKIAQQVKLRTDKEKEKLKWKEEIKSLQQELISLQLQLQKTRADIAQNQEAEKQLLVELRNLPLLRTVNEIYLEQNKIDGALITMEARRRKDLETARKEERRNARLADDYSEQDFFTLNPSLASFIDSCSLPVESGTVYAERLIKEGYYTREQVTKQFPFWPFCLVVQSADQAQIEKKLQGMAEDILTPVFVLSAMEARAAAEGDYPYSVIYPEFWQTVLEKESFVQWQEKIQQIARQSKLEREEKEFLLLEVKELFSKFTTFLNKFPQGELKTWLIEEKALEQRLFDLTNRLKEGERAEEEASSTYQRCEQNIRNLDLTTSILNDKIKQALEWERKEREAKRVETDLGQVIRDKEKIQEQLVLEQEIEQKYLGEKKHLQQQIAVQERELDRLQGKELYAQLREYPPLASRLAEFILDEKRKRLQESLWQIDRERGVLQNQIQEYELEVQNFAERLSGYNLVMEEQAVFPLDGRVKLENLRLAIEHLNPKINNAKEVVTEIKLEEAKISSRLTTKEEDYRKKFSRSPHSFEQPLSVVEEILQADKLRIQKELQIVENQINKLRGKKEKWEELKATMEKSNWTLQFLNDNISSEEMSPEETNSFPYQSHKIILELLGLLEKSRLRLDHLQREVEGARKDFEYFCQNKNFQNEKMRQNALNGIRQKHSYREMLEWEKNLRHTIQMANSLAETSMQAQHEDIKHFINQLHLHLVHICDEIAVIEKTTTVKIDDQYKTIYEIKTPTWEETKAKERIFEHLEWMTERLSSETYKNQDGLEDSQKIRKDIESGLSPLQLFNRICPEKNFSVGVRKVSNDKRISNYPVDWGTSNNWSGGEKWSKNMALFLGIQNYLAQKRHPLAKQIGRNRTVIVDNPFGQASSDHVLEPVFFIAEKLGFQILALTALAEGKFLRDYFPIIYSCRLRPLGGTAVMDKELRINQAFFQDNQPEVLKRLGQIKSIDLLAGT